MCGHDWCSVRISKEITDFLSGKEAEYAWDKPTKTAALTPEQQEILRQRGNLSPAEIHKLAAKAKGKLDEASEKLVPGDEAGKASCHSDYVDDATAKRQLVTLGVGVRTSESVV